VADPEGVEAMGHFEGQSQRKLVHCL